VVTGLRPLPVTTAAILLAGFATPPLEAGLRALWPAVLADPAQVAVAYGLDAASQELLYICGPLLVIAAAVVSPEAALLLTGLLGIAGTLVVVSSAPSRGWRGHPRAADWAGPLRSPGLRTLLVALGCAATSLGVIGVAAVTYAGSRHSSTASGFLLAANAGGAFIGGLTYAVRRPGGPAHRRLPWLVLGLAAGFLPLSLAPALPLILMLGLALLAGLFLAPVLSCVFTLVDELAPRGTVTEAFAWIVTAMAVGAALGSAAAGRAGDLAGPSGAYACAAAGGVLALAVLLAGRRSLRGGRAGQDTVPADDRLSPAV
jgi:dipeptide/tripeptide permease